LYDRRFASWFVSPPHSAVQRASSQCAILTRCAEGQLSAPSSPAVQRASGEFPILMSCSAVHRASEQDGMRRL
jgi:hypothetical protein